MTTTRFFFLAIAMFWGASACGDSDGPTDPPVPASVRVSPTSTTLHALGASEQFTATVHDQNGNTMAGAGVSWAITDPSVATVTGNGLVTAVGNGNTTLAASAGAATENAGVLVDQLVADIRVSLGGDTLVALGDTVRLTAEGTDANGHSVGGAEFTWLTGDSLVVTVDGSGLVTAVGDGSTTVRAQADGAIGSAAIVVRQHATSMTVSPARTTLRAIGDTVRLIAEALDANGRALTDADFQWRALNDSVVSVDSVGLVTATGNGTTAVTAARDDMSATATVTVAQVLASVIVLPSRITLEEKDTIRLRAKSLDSNGHELVPAAHEWVSSNERVASVDSTGLVHARVVGTALVSASADTLSGAAEITVRLPHVPPNPAVDEGTSHSLQTSGIRVDHALTRRTRTGTSHAVVYADLDSDGDVDLFYAPLNRTLNPLPGEVFLNEGNSGYRYAPGFLAGHTPATVHARKALSGDFNGDRRPDIFVLASGYDREPFPGEANYLLLSSNSGYVLAPGLDSIIGYHHGGASADVDADGDLDVFVTDTEVPYFLINDGHGHLRKDTIRISGVSARSIFTAELVDVDQDGHVDLLVAGHEYAYFPSQILWGDTTGIYSTAKGTVLPGVPGYGVVVDIDVGDTDGDSDRDIVLNRTGDHRSGPGFYSGYYVQLLHHTTPRAFADVTEERFSDSGDPEEEWFDWLRLYDATGDGYVDVVVDDVETALPLREVVWENDGFGRFSRRHRDFIPPNLDADSGTSHSLQASGFAVDHAQVRSGRLDAVYAIAYGDFNDDNHIDAFYAPASDGRGATSPEFFVNDGMNRFSLAPHLLEASRALPPEPSKVLTGDYNGDGRIDLMILGNGVNDTSAPYLILSTPAGYRVDTELDHVAGIGRASASADIDSDGDVDLMLSDGSRRFLLVNNGHGMFVKAELMTPTGYILTAELVDVDGDGYVDILQGGHEHGGSDTQVIWGDSTGAYDSASATVLPTVTGIGVIRDIDVSDTDGDGRKDILVTRTGDGTGSLGFYEGYYLQMHKQEPGRRFRDITDAALSPNRSDDIRINTIRIYDIDADGDVDIVVDDFGWPALVWENDGSGRFMSGQGR